MIEKHREALERWAAERGLMFKAEETFPPATERLRAGTGLGERRSAMVDPHGPLGLTREGWHRKRPERATHHVCQGELLRGPKPLWGRIGHHVHLIDRGQQGDGNRWVAEVDTVLLAEVPSGSRAACMLTAAPTNPAKVAFAIGAGPGESPDPLRNTLEIPSSSVEREGVTWTAWPAEAESWLTRIVSPAAAAMADAPEGTRVEVEFGTLTVVVPGRAVSRAEELEALCRLAGAVAEAMDSAAAEAGGLDPARALEPEADTPRKRWAVAGADLITWHASPAGVTHAQESYKSVVRPGASGRSAKAAAIAAVALVVVTLVGAAAAFGLGYLAAGPIGGAIGAIFVLVSGAWGGPKVVGEVFGDMKQGMTRTAAVAFGLEAFARGYAKHASLVEEDPNELRHRLDSPVPGRPQKAWQGELAEGVPGHLALWLDPTTTPHPPRHWILAVVPEGAVPEGPYEVARRDGYVVLAEEIAAERRTTAKLDELRGMLSRKAVAR